MLAIDQVISERPAEIKMHATDNFDEYFLPGCSSGFRARVRSGIIAKSLAEILLKILILPVFPHTMYNPMYNRRRESLIGSTTKATDK